MPTQKWPRSVNFSLTQWAAHKAITIVQRITLTVAVLTKRNIAIGKTSGKGGQKEPRVWEKNAVVANTWSKHFNFTNLHIFSRSHSAEIDNPIPNVHCSLFTVMSTNVSNQLVERSFGARSWSIETPILPKFAMPFFTPRCHISRWTSCSLYPGFYHELQ